MSDASLATLQHWVRSVVTEPGDLPEKLRAAAEAHGLTPTEVVASKRGLPADVRVGIYSRAYVMRLLDCMRADFPVLRAFIGDAVFDAFVRAYLIERPPSSPSLYDLSAAFPQFLDETKPDDDAMFTFPAEIARFERARSEAAHARGIEDDPPDALEAPFAWLATEVRTAPCLRLLESAFPLVDFVNRIEAGERPEIPTPRQTLVAVSRMAYRVHIAELEPWQHAFLRACERSASVYAAAQSAGANLADLALWLPVAASRGYVQSFVDATTAAPAPSSSAPMRR